MAKHAAVIVTYNRSELLKECVEAVLLQEKPYDCVVILDNASTDGTSSLLSAWESREGFIILREKENLGGAGGFCRALHAAMETDADWFTIMDDDSVLRKDFLKEIDRAMHLHKDCSVLAGVPLTDGLRIGHRRRVSGGLIRREIPVPAEEYKKDFFYCRIASFCGLVVSRSAVEEAGYPLADYFIWYDDTEYCLRLSEKRPILNWNSAVIDHKAETGSASQGMTWKDYYGIRNRIRTSALHYGRLTTWTLAFYKMGKGCFTFLRMALSGRAEKGAAQLRLVSRAVADGLAGRGGVCESYRPGS